MKQEILTVKSNVKIAEGIYRMELSGSAVKLHAGQFAEFGLPNFTLRRPFSIADANGEELTVLYKVVGDGTLYMTKIAEGEKIDVLNGLGNGFSSNAKKPLLIGGGIGVAPLYLLAKTYAEKGVLPTAVFGFRTASEAYYIDEFKRYCNVTVATDDGTLGFKGNAVQALASLEIDYDYYHACGALPMLKALQKVSVSGELSLEARMGCGFGACMGCSVMTTNGAKRVCKEGPVFSAKEVIL